ncbi:unnamed protein product [Cylicocyclus nassatus]|uniref:Uncharacterized protein n=1 Tax=Cylicocyclus nassatus TaxID=53992 RepID=A0AA36HBZ2_CYLNA|nr:unnamed protein product [Cylicocyclus nassatus]
MQVVEIVSYASFDVVSLYTNVDNNGAINAVLTLLEENENNVSTFGFNRDDIRFMLNARALSVPLTFLIRSDDGRDRNVTNKDTKSS